ncbi:MAG: hypothetical protein OXC68_11750 [Aestuariivita sp.]|nr:hypothetical protein [Aestuariivita sp.]
MESRIDASLAKTESAMDRLRADMERRDKEAAVRDKENQRWIVGLFIATIVILGILIRWPVPPA